MAKNVDNLANQNSLELTIPDLKLPTAKEIGDQVQDGYDKIYLKLKAEIDTVPRDPADKDARAAMISLAAKISKTKVALDKRSAGLVEDQKAIVKSVTAKRTAMKEKLDGWRDEVRGPVTAWEEIDKARNKKVEDSFNFLNQIKSTQHDGIDYADMNADQVKSLMVKIKGMVPADPEVYENLAEKFEGQAAQAILDLMDRVDKLDALELERAELEQMRADKAKREAEDAERAEAEAKRAAAEAEEKRLADQAAEAQRLAKAAAEQEVEDQRIRAETAEAKAKADEQARIDYQKEVEEQRKQDELQAEKDRIAAAERAEADRKAQAAKAEAKRLADIEAERTAAAEREKQAIDAERGRVARIKAEEDRAEAKRREDEQHIAEINGRAAQAVALTVPDMSVANIDLLIAAIAAGKIPSVKITY